MEKPPIELTVEFRDSTEEALTPSAEVRQPGYTEKTRSRPSGTIILKKFLRYAACRPVAPKS